MVVPEEEQGSGGGREGCGTAEGVEVRYLRGGSSLHTRRAWLGRVREVELPFTTAAMEAVSMVVHARVNISSRLVNIGKIVVSKLKPWGS